MGNQDDSLQVYENSKHLGFTDQCPDCKGEGEVPLTDEERCGCEQPCSCYNYKTCECCGGDGKVEATLPGRAGQAAARQAELLDRPPQMLVGTDGRGKEPFIVNGRLSEIQSVVYKNVIGTSIPVIIRPAPPISRWLQRREKFFKALDWLKLKWFNFKLCFHPQWVDDPLYDLMNEDSIIPPGEREPLYELAQEVVDAPGGDPTE